MPLRRAETPYRFMSLLGFVSSGDLGELTCYRSKLGKIVVFSKTWPKKYPTLAQLTGRARMSFAAEQWTALPEAYKQKWKLVAQKASLCMTGYNLWVRWYLNPQYWDFIGLIHETGVNLFDAMLSTIPKLPANPKVSPTLLSNPPTKGAVRYGQSYTTMRPNTIAWLNFLPYDAQVEIGIPLTGYLTVYGYGKVDCTPLLNGRWCRASFESWIMPHKSQLEIKVWFPDTTFDTTEITILCRDLNP